MNGTPSRDEFTALKLLLEAVKNHVDEYETFARRARENHGRRIEMVEQFIDGLGPVLADLKVAIGNLAIDFAAIRAQIDGPPTLGRPLTIAESKRITNHLCQDGRLREGSAGICPTCERRAITDTMRETYDDQQLRDPDPTGPISSPVIPVGNRESARPCGCDPGAGWVCEDHRARA